MNHIFLLKNTIRNYAWGHESLIKELIGGGPETPVPQAEMWIGAHPGASSRLVVDGNDVSLNEAIAAAPLEWLGERLTKAGIRELPFLAKLLAASRPLSIQTHPNLERARAGFEREDAAGIPRNADNRNYKDANHKPEILCALTPFWGLCGFRSGGDIADDLGAVAATGSAATKLERLRQLAKAGDYKALVREVLSLGDDRSALVEALVHAAAGRKQARWKFLAKSAALFPGDAGLFFFVILHFLEMEPGDALFQAAGILHAYVEGFGVEVMANSDNVLRGGLTPKYIDVDELVDNLDLEADAAPTRCDQSKSQTFPVRTPEFQLRRMFDGEFQWKVDGPEVIIATHEGTVILTTNERVELAQGESAFLRPDCHVEVRTAGECFRVSVPH